MCKILHTRADRVEAYMPAREIPYPQWPMFLGKFGFRHFGWNVSLQQKSSGLDTLLSADDCFLEELATDDLKQITIVIGSPFREFRTHIVTNPRRVRVFPATPPSLEIESADGSTTVVRLHQPYRAA